MTSVAVALGAALAVVVGGAVASGARFYRRLRRAEAEIEKARHELETLDAALIDSPASLAVAVSSERLLCYPSLLTTLGLPHEARVKAEWAVPDVTARLMGFQADLLPDAVERLVNHGRAFELRAAHIDGQRTFAIAGRRVEAGGRTLNALWFADADAEAAAEERLEAQHRSMSLEIERLRALLDALPLPVWMRARDMSLVFCNAAYVRALDLESPAVALLEGHELSAGVVDEGGQALAQRVQRTGFPQTESHHIVTGGARRLFEFTETPLPVSGHIGGFAQDFTQLEEVQAELGHHIEAHADVLELLRSGVATFDQGQRLIFFNSYYAELWDLDPEWLQTEPTLGEIMETLREHRRLPEVADFGIFKRQMAARFHGLLEPEEEYLFLPDERTVRAVAAPHPLGGLVFLYEDVTDRLALERSYNTLIEVQRETIDGLSEGIAVFGTDGRLKLHNAAFARLWGVDDLSGEPHVSDVVSWMRFGDGDVADEHRTRLVASVIARDPGERQQVNVAGHIFAYAFAPLADGSVMLTTRDITDSHAVEEALRERNRALVEADRLKTEFLANVSYELRTPLNTIIGFSEILRQSWFGALNERQTEYVDGLFEASQSLLALIDDILDVSMMEAGQIELEFESVDLGDMLNDLETALQPRLQAQNLHLAIEVEPGFPTIVSDRRRLRQVIASLVNNAIKFTSPGGAVRLQACRRDGDEVGLRVMHSGVALAPEERERLHAAAATPGGIPARSVQSGLALTIARRIVHLHGGTVELESEPGGMTSVTCILPTRRER